MIFAYPTARESRLHGPAGYESHESYRPWLRDEFAFRCVYCLKREAWGQATADYDLDHFKPHSVSPELRFDYLNLIYACRRCNLVKLDHIIDDPVQTLTRQNLTLRPEGSLVGGEPRVDRLILQLDLNSPRMCKWRVMWIRIVQLAREQDPNLHRLLVGYPENLPDLTRLRPPVNTKPKSVLLSCHALRKRSELPDEY